MESFELFWAYNSWYRADWNLKKWGTGAMRSQLDLIKKFVGTIRRHRLLI